MRFSIYLNAQSPGPEHDLAVIDAVTEQALLADRSGFVGVCLTEHHFTGYNTYGNPFMYGCYLAPQLQNCHVILSVAVPALHNPMNFAEQCQLLDVLTRGRCVVGVGTGGSPREYQGLGRDPKQRGALMDEVLQIAFAGMSKTLDDADLEYATPHSSGTLSLRIMPTSWTKPHPRFARASLSDEGIIHTAKQGWALMTAREAVEETGRKWALYDSTLASQGHDPETLAFAREWSLVQKLVFVGESDQAALDAVQAPLDYLAAQSQRSFGGTAANAGFKSSVVGVSAVDRDDFLKRAMIVGSPDTVAAAIEDYASVGIDHMALVFLYGQMDPAVGDASLRLFIDEVMPRFADPQGQARNAAVASIISS